MFADPACLVMCDDPSLAAGDSAVDLLPQLLPFNLVALVMSDALPGEIDVDRGGRAGGFRLSLNRLFDSRNRADYGMAPITSDDARIAIDRAKIVVDAVDAWLAEHK